MAQVQAKATLQVEVASDEELLARLRERGLKIVEVYAKWCGPCVPVTTIYKKARLEVQDDTEALTFLKVCAEKVQQGLEVLRTREGKSEPLFLVFRNGTLKETIHGLNAPTLWRCIKEYTPMNPAADEPEENPFVQQLKNPGKKQPVVDDKAARQKSFLSLDHLKGK